AVRARGRRQRLRHRGRRGELAVESLDRELALEARHAEHLGARYRAARPDANGLEQLVAPHALRRDRIRHRASTVYEDRPMTRRVAASSLHAPPNLPARGNAGTTGT